jgi:hypothetical protein
MQQDAETQDLLDLLFNIENGGDMFLRYIGWL